MTLEEFRYFDQEWLRKAGGIVNNKRTKGFKFITEEVRNEVIIQIQKTKIVIRRNK